MAKLEISHHERVGDRPHRWHVHLRGRSKPMLVELPDDEREALDLNDDEIHELLPLALQRRHAHHPDDFPEAHEHDEAELGTETPVRVYQMHFMM
jgi:hypothetical protein